MIRFAAVGTIAAMIRFAPICLILAASWGHASANEPALLGCWRAVKIVLHTPDGVKTEDTTGRCTLHFKEEQYVSVCGTAAGRAVTTTYRYSIVRPGVYQATMAGSSFRTDLLGSTRETTYQVSDERLRTVSESQTTRDGRRSGARVELEAAKAACP